MQGEESRSGAAAGGGGWLAVPSVSALIKYSCLLCWSSREKSSVEQEIKEKEESIRQRTSEVQVRLPPLRPSAAACARVRPYPPASSASLGGFGWSYS